MALGIKTYSDLASFEQNVLIGGRSLTLRLNFNSTDKKWRLDIFEDDNPLLLGVALAPRKSPTQRYSLEEFREGNFWLLRLRDTDQPLKYDNFGLSKDYGLFYLTVEEEEELGL